MKTKLLVTTWLALGSAFISVAHAQTASASIGADAPTSNVELFKSATVDGGFSWQGTTTNTRDVGQSFTTSAGFTLDKFTLQIAGNFYGSQRLALSGTSFEATLLTFQAGTVNVTASQSLGVGTLPSPLESETTFNYGSKYLTFDLQNTTLADSTRYGIVLHFITPKSDQAINFNSDYASTVNGGNTIFSSDGTNWSATGNSFIYYIQSASSIPEPSSYTLFAAAGACVPVLLRRRRRGLTV